MLIRTAVALLLALSMLMLTGCEETITRENFDQIEVGMDMAEVESILGGSGSLQAASGVGIGASGLPEKQGGEGDTKDYLWGDETEGILVKFKEGKVFHKQPYGL